jgi:SNF2 family DNA or RNA helicase
VRNDRSSTHLHQLTSISQTTQTSSACMRMASIILCANLTSPFRLTRMRQMACHPDLVLKSKSSANTFADAQVGEVTVCRICNDIAEDAIQSKCRHIFDRECIKQYLNTAIEMTVRFEIFSFPFRSFLFPFGSRKKRELICKCFL